MNSVFLSITTLDVSDFDVKVGIVTDDTEIPLGIMRYVKLCLIWELPVLTNFVTFRIFHMFRHFSKKLQISYRRTVEWNSISVIAKTFLRMFQLNSATSVFPVDWGLSLLRDQRQRTSMLLALKASPKSSLTVARIIFWLVQDQTGLSWSFHPNMLLRIISIVSGKHVMFELGSAWDVISFLQDFRRYC